jgi:hypothetical protein
MFKRTIEFKITKPVKAPEDTSTKLSETEQLKRWEYYADFAEDLIWDAAKLLAGYMVLDTFRKAMIAKAARGACGCH